MQKYLPIFGFETDPDRARVVIIPAPFDATCSYEPGTHHGPDAVLAASVQLDFADRRFGDILAHGIAMEAPQAEIAPLSLAARASIEAAREARLHVDEPLTGDEPIDETTAAQVERACEHVNTIIAGRVSAALDRGAVPCVLGGEHAMSLGAMRAVGDRVEAFGVLQIDAHLDLRRAYQGLRYSHASVMLNALEMVSSLQSVTAVGIRDYCEDEARFAGVRGVATHYWDDLADRLDGGVPWHTIAAEIIEGLPENVYVTFDIDGLEPSLCPSTGTPVPGGLSWNQASILLQSLRDSGKNIVGFDLMEVAPGNSTPAGRIDAIIGARALYRLCGAALGSRPTR